MVAMAKKLGILVGVLGLVAGFVGCNAAVGGGGGIVEDIIGDGDEDDGVDGNGDGADDQDPVVNVGESEVEAGLGSRVALDATASSTPAGGGVTCVWQQTDGPATLVIETSPDNTCDAGVTSGLAGVYEFTVTVTDENDRSSTDVVTVTIEGEEGETSLVLETYASNTGGASGIDVDAEGKLFAVNSEGLWGPVADGQNLLDETTLFGATNLDDDDLFQEEQSSLVLAITDSGEYFVGSNCCTRLAVVQPAGGDAAQALELATVPTAVDPSNVKPETMVIVPENFDGVEIRPSMMLVGRETSFSELSAIDVEREDRAVINIDNPIEDPDELPNPEDALNRNAHHLAFGPDGTLYSSRSLSSPDAAGIQTIATDGTPAELPGTINLSANTFVVLENGDLIIDGIYSPSGGDRLQGLLIWSAETQSVHLGLALSADDVAEDDEMIVAPDGTIFLSLPDRNEIVRVIDNRKVE